MTAIRTIMVTPAVAVNAGQTVRELIQAFRDYHFNYFPVVDEEGRLRGRVSLASLLRLFVPEGPQSVHVLRGAVGIRPHSPGQEHGLLPADTLEKTLVADIASQETQALNAGSTLEEARDFMALHGETVVPVVDEEGVLKGVITLFSVVSSLLRERGVSV